MENLKTNLLSVFAESTVRSLLNGNRTPSLKMALKLQEKFNIPVEAWRDIKSFIAKSSQKTAN